MKASRNGQKPHLVTITMIFNEKITELVTDLGESSQISGFWKFLSWLGRKANSECGQDLLLSHLSIMHALFTFIKFTHYTKLVTSKLKKIYKITFF